MHSIRRLREEKETPSTVIDIYHEVSKDVSKEYKKVNPISASKAPKGNGCTKGDLLMQRLAMEFKYDPIKEMIKLAKHNKTSNELKFKIASQLTDYYLPKVKAIDTNPNQGEVISINIIQPDNQ